jgi:hypothetical protein
MRSVFRVSLELLPVTVTPAVALVPAAPIRAPLLNSVARNGDGARSVTAGATQPAHATLRRRRPHDSGRKRQPEERVHGVRGDRVQERRYR